MQPRSRLALLVLVPFVAFTAWVILRAGPVGFVALALREPWGAQVLLDLVIACVLALGALVPDARSRGLRAWPWCVATALVGSIGLLGYYVYRDLAAPQGTRDAERGPRRDAP